MAESGFTFAFMGLGVMGYHMAVNLRNKLDHSARLVIADTNSDACKRFLKETSGAGPSFIVNNGREAIEAADVLITVLPSSEAVKSVYLDPETGVLGGLKTNSKPKLLIECGTVASNTIQEVSDTFKRYDHIDFVDAPISGGPMGSKAGTLTFMVGSPEEIFSRVKSILLLMGNPDSIFHCGDVGSGTAFKLINNYISIISVLNVSEAYNIAKRMNLDLDKLTNVLQTGTAQCWVVSKNNPVPGIHPDAPASHGYEGGFRLELALKVLGLARELAEDVGAQTALDKAALAVFKEASEDASYAGKDARVIYKFLTEKS